MSTEKGNTSRTRSQKHKNKTVFKNNLHDTSHTTKFINNLVIVNVCSKCKGVIEWKIKYKKYKPLKSPATCVKCHQKNVKFAYHTICTECSKKSKVCPKCGKEETLIAHEKVVNPDDILKNQQIQELVKALPERRRRTFYRHVNKVLEDKEELANEEYFISKLKEMNIDGKGSSASFDGFSDEDSEEDSDGED